MSNVEGPVSSSSMISLQRSMHSSQMYTPGPAISFLTWRWDLPQKLQRSCSFESVGRARGIPSLRGGSDVYGRRAPSLVGAGGRPNKRWSRLLRGGRRPCLCKYLCSVDGGVEDRADRRGRVRDPAADDRRLPGLL